VSERLLFQCKIGVQVDLGRLDRLVSEPERDDATIDASLQELHSRRVTQRVWRDSLVRERRAVRFRRGAVFGHQPFDGVWADGAAARTGEDWRVGREREFSKPSVENRDDLASKWGAAKLTPFAETANVGASAEQHMLTLESDQLRNSEASLNGDEQQGAIAPPEPGDGAGRTEQGLDLLVVEKFDNSAFEALARDGEHTLAVERVCGLRECDISEEGVKRSESCVATTGRVFAFALKVVEEVAQESSVEVGNGESGRGAAEASRGEAQKHAECVSVG
jgi:hypothetical protein